MYEERILAFIDILGFSDAINNTMEGDIENKEKTNRINILLDTIQKKLLYKKGKYSWELEHIYREYKGLPKANYLSRLIVNQFSDTIILSMLKIEEDNVYELLLFIAYLCVTAIKYGFFLRGAVVCGKVYHTNNVIFGPALIKAYNLEKDYAIYPRIVLDNDFIEYIQNISYKQYFKELLKKDDDDIYYINYFDIGIKDIEKDFPVEEYITNLESNIIKIRYDKNQKIKLKYLWLKKKYNMLIAKYKYRNKNTSLNYYFKDIKLIK